MARADGTGRARRSGFVPLCAGALGILVSLWLSGCLNPLPDDQPSSHFGGNAVSPPATSDDELSGSGAGSGNAGPAAPNFNAESPPSDPSSEADADAPPDAGAPDAGVTSDDDAEGIQGIQ